MLVMLIGNRNKTEGQKPILLVVLTATDLERMERGEVPYTLLETVTLEDSQIAFMSEDHMDRATAFGQFIKQMRGKDSTTLCVVLDKAGIQKLRDGNYVKLEGEERLKGVLQILFIAYQDTVEEAHTFVKTFAADNPDIPVMDLTGLGGDDGNHGRHQP